MNRFKVGNNGPLSLALDGRWGSGKTFFVERWTEQLKQNGRFVISFNAWQHDGAPEPSLALIGELRSQIHELSKNLDSTEPATELLDSQMKAVISSAKKTIKPVAIAILSGLTKRLIGSSLTDLTEAATASNDEDGQESGPADPNREAKILDKALDVYFDQALAGYELHQASIKRFQNDLESLAHSVANISGPDGKPIGPIIIIVDELDRCRPTFAVQLLEGIKHLFSVDNVCFVFATNLAQLTASVQVVYGSNFSGREYLGRFFDRDLTLPNHSANSFTKLLFRHPLPENVWIGEFPVEKPELEDPYMDYWLLLSQAMKLSLRQQQQAFSILQTSCESYPSNTRLPGVWLMFLSQLKAVDPDIFTYLHEKPSGSMSLADIRSLFAKMDWDEKKIIFKGSHIERPRSELLLSLINSYLRYSKLPINLAHIEINNDGGPFSMDISRYLTNNNAGEDRTVLGSVFHAVAAAGMFSY